MVINLTAIVITHLGAIWPSEVSILHGLLNSFVHSLLCPNKNDTGNTLAGRTAVGCR